MTARSGLLLVVLAGSLAACAERPEVARLPDGRVEIRGERSLSLRYFREAQAWCGARSDIQTGKAREDCQMAAYMRRAAEAQRNPRPGCWSAPGTVRCDRERVVFTARPEEVR